MKNSLPLPLPPSLKIDKNKNKNKDSGSEVGGKLGRDFMRDILLTEGRWSSGSEQENEKSCDHI